MDVYVDRHRKRHKDKDGIEIDADGKWKYSCKKLEKCVCILYI